jgi:hypothetical protein
MKKVISALLITALLAAFALPASAADLTTADALTVLRAAAGITTLSDTDIARLGISGNPSTADALRILRVAAGLPAVAVEAALRLNTDIFADLGLTVSQIEAKRGRRTGGAEFVTFERGIGEYQFGDYKGERRSAHIWEIPASRLFANMGSSVHISEIDIPGLRFIRETANDFSGKYIAYFRFDDSVNHGVHIYLALSRSGIIGSGDILSIESDYYKVDFDVIITDVTVSVW